MRKCIVKGCPKIAMCQYCVDHCDGTTRHGRRKK